MKKRNPLGRAGAVAALGLAICLLGGCAVVDLNNGDILFGARQVGEEQDTNAFDEQFDPDAYVASVWEEEAMPTFEESAQDLAVVRDALAQDFDAACETYGRLSNDKGSWVFVVKGQGTVDEVNRESRNGVALLSTDSGPVSLQIGPVYQGASLRDALPFIKFSDFTNQVAFSGISSALNRKVDSDVITASNIDGATGQTVTFTGAFSVKSGGDDIVVTPVALTIGG